MYWQVIALHQKCMKICQYCQNLTKIEWQYDGQPGNFTPSLCKNHRKMWGLGTTNQMKKQYSLSMIEQSEAISHGLKKMVIIKDSLFTWRAQTLLLLQEQIKPKTSKLLLKVKMEVMAFNKEMMLCLGFSRTSMICHLNITIS